MNKIDNNMSAYLHTYEAYRVPKGTSVKDMAGKDVTNKNGDLDDGIYIIYSNGVTVKVIVKG